MCHGFCAAQIPVRNQNNILVQEERVSYTIIKPGTNADGWWTNDDLVKQLKHVIPVFEKIHPNCELLLCFDNSQNHHAKAPDALVANRLNLKDGGKDGGLFKKELESTSSS